MRGRAAGLAIACGVFANEALAGDRRADKPPSETAALSFDPALLAERGVDPGIAAYFRHAPRFRPGRHPVHLVVNGRSRGSVYASFDQDGELLGDITLLEAAGLRVPVPGSFDVPGVSRRFTSLFPQASLRQQPAQERVELIVPAVALLPPSSARRGYAGGGSAALVNYDAMAMTSRFPGGTVRYRSLGTELGFNTGGWIVRSRQVFTMSRQQARREHLYGYAARTLEGVGAHVQIGQVTMLSPLFAGGAITGVQVLPEAALQEASVGEGALVAGVALSPSRVEVRQNGALIHNAVVPAGPFRLDGIALLSQGIDLEVSVLGDDGQERRFTVPSAMLRGLSVGTAPGYALATGRVRQFGAIDRDMPLFAAASKDWVLTAGTRLTAGLMVGEGYRSVGLAWQQSVSETVRADVRQRMSQDQRGARSGQQIQAMLSAAVSSRWSLGASLTHRTPGFRDLADSAWPRERTMLPFARRQATGSVTRGMGTLGMLSGAWSRTSSYGAPTSSRLSLSWSSMFAGTTVAVDIEHVLNGDVRENHGNTAYVTLSVPLAPRRRFQAVLREDSGGRQRHGVRLNEQVTDGFAYGVGVERDSGRGTAVDLRTSVLPRFAQIDLGYVHRGSGISSDRIAVRGGMVAHAAGVTLSPYPVRDTFALIDVGDLSGVKLRTPQGPVWTDGAGRAVAGQLPAYRNSRVEMDTASLPRHVDVGNGYKEVGASRGSVQHLRFEVVVRRRLLLTARMADGSTLPKGASVRDADGRYVTTVLADGRIFLEQAYGSERLHVVLDEAARCRLSFTDASQASNGFYETAAATCLSP